MLICCSVHFAGMLMLSGHVGVRHHIHMSRSGFMTSALLHLHGHCCRKRATAENREPQQ